MPYIHQNTNWPKLTWNSEPLAATLAAVRHKQGRLLGQMEGLGFDQRAEASLSVLTADIVKSSAIEGENLNPDEVRSSLAERLGLSTAGLPIASRNVDGIVDLMLDATSRYTEPLTKERLCAWHSSLFPTGRSGMDQIIVGEWRNAPMRVISGPMGKDKIHFEAPDANRLETEMSQFLDWFNKPNSYDAVLKAGVAHFWFVTIHPFEDGNGRIARAIADMSLARADGTKDRFYSMTAQIAAKRRDYYDKLEAAQRGDVDITRWLVWFLDCLDGAIEGALEQTTEVLRKAKLWQRINRRPVNERQQLVINRLLNNFDGFLTNRKYTQFAKCSPDTALRDIRELLERGILIQNIGSGRSTSYRLATPEEVRE